MPEEAAEGTVTMNICIPVNEDQGLQSEVCAHFGSAPVFMIVNTDSASCHAIPNRNEHHAHGMCRPLESLRGESINGMVVGGIGMGALNKLVAQGIRVYLAQHATVAETVEALKAGTLQLMEPDMACAHHRHGHA